jgi:8-amino-3,8-dideoxy-alpha-D-manno-octulosonate transaminase
VPAGGEDSCSFISWFLPTAEHTQAAVEEMRNQGILAGNFYWYNNNWHYIRKWDHLKQAGALHRLSPEQTQALQQLGSSDFSVSDELLSRCVSTAVSLAWTPEQIKEKGEKMAAAIRKVL